MFYRQYRVLNIAIPGASCSLRSYYTPSSLNLHLHYGAGMVDWLSMQGKPLSETDAPLARSSEAAGQVILLHP